MPPPENIDMQLHHKNGKKRCNASDNLVWLTPAQHSEEHRKMAERLANGK